MSDSTLNTDPVPSPTEVMARFGQEVLNDKNVDAIDEIAAEDFVDLDPVPGQGSGREGLKEFLATVAFPAFPDQQWVTEEQITSGEKVCPASPGTAPTKAPSWGSRPPADRSP